MRLARFAPLLFWFFLLMSPTRLGYRSVVVGPFGAEANCEEIRKAVLGQSGFMSIVWTSACWPDVTLGK